MPQFNRNFAQGKMNKDLDERLVPAGQYRDAVNVEISTSEGSNVGALESCSRTKANRRFFESKLMFKRFYFKV